METKTQTTFSLPPTEAMTSDVLEEVCMSLDDAIKEAGMNLDEEGLEREVTAFLQRV